MAHCTTEPTRITLPISGVSAQARLKENPQSFVVPNVLAAASRLPIKIGDEMIGGVGVSGSLGSNDEVYAYAGIDKAAEHLK